MISTALRNFPFLKKADRAALEMAAMVGTYSKGEKLLDTGQNANHLFIVVKGVLVESFQLNGEELVTQIAVRGQLMTASVPFFLGGPSGRIIKTVRPATVVILDRRVLTKLRAQYPNIGRLMEFAVLERIRLMEEREDAFLAYKIEERISRFIHAYPNLFSLVPQKYIASYLRIEPETLSRYKTAMMQRANRRSMPRRATVVREK